MADNSAKVSTRVMIISDTHNFQFGNSSIPFRLPLPRVDLLLHCGDMTYSGGAASYQKFLEMLSHIDAELKLVIAGNHDMDLDREYWAKHLILGRTMEDHKEALDVLTSSAAKEAGIIYLDEGTHSFELTNGARFNVYASPYQPEFCDWAFPYQRNEDRFNPFLPEHTEGDTKNISIHPVPDFGNVDIIMTHGPPSGFLDAARGEFLGCHHLRQAVYRARPLLHCFGHIHEGHGMSLVQWKSNAGPQPTKSGAIENERHIPSTFPETVKLDLQHGAETVFVNGAIMDVRYQPVNAPWVLELDLPVRDKTIDQSLQM